MTGNNEMANIILIRIISHSNFRLVLQSWDITETQKLGIMADLPKIATNKTVYDRFMKVRLIQFKKDVTYSAYLCHNFDNIYCYICLHFSWSSRSMPTLASWPTCGSTELENTSDPRQGHIMVPSGLPKSYQSGTTTVAQPTKRKAQTLTFISTQWRSTRIPSLKEETSWSSATPTSITRSRRKPITELPVLMLWPRLRNNTHGSAWNKSIQSWTEICIHSDGPRGNDLGDVMIAG